MGLLSDLKDLFSSMQQDVGFPGPFGPGDNDQVVDWNGKNRQLATSNNIRTISLRQRLDLRQQVLDAHGERQIDRHFPGPGYSPGVSSCRIGTIMYYGCLQSAGTFIGRSERCKPGTSPSWTRWSSVPPIFRLLSLELTNKGPDVCRGPRLRRK